MRTDFNPKKEIETALAVITQGKVSKLEHPVETIEKLTGIAPVAIRRVLNKLKQTKQIKLVFVKNTSAEQIDFIELDISLRKHLKRRFDTEPNIQEAVEKILQTVTEKKSKTAVVETVVDKPMTRGVKIIKLGVKKVTKPGSSVDLTERVRTGNQVKNEIPRAVPNQFNFNGIAGVIDYDNVRASQVTLDYTLSFAKVKQYLQGMGGQVIFADAFLSPYSNSQRVINKLWHCGWRAVACPQRIKDKDSVDMKIKWQVVSYLETPGITTIVVFSDDRDFNDLIDKAADYGKRLLLVNSSILKENCEGRDELPNKLIHRNVVTFVRCFQYLQNGYEPTSGREKRVRDLIKKVCEKLISFNGDRNYGFKALSRALRVEMHKEGFGDFNDNEYDVLIRALLEEKVIYLSPSNTGLNGNEYYFVDHSHRIFNKSATTAAR